MSDSPTRGTAVTPGQARDASDYRTPRSIPQRLALALLRGYQLLFSPMFAGSCRFTPSCSAYAAEAVARFGVLRGSWLSLRRLARCRPLGGHGFDPVPDPAISQEPSESRPAGQALSFD